MPVAAVAGAVFAGAELATGVLGVFQTIAAVGAITAGVGAVTGDQDLMKIGAIGGLAGGVGMFAQNQGWLNTAQAAAKAGGNTATMIRQQAPGMESVAPKVDTGMGAVKTTANTVTGDNLNTSVFGSLQKFADLLKNKDGTYDKNLLAIGANFIGGAFDDKKKAETDYYRSRTASEDAQRTNANSVPSLAGLKVSDKNIFTPNASTYTPVRVGLINAR